jgi:predicted metallopeptidase
MDYSKELEKVVKHITLSLDEFSHINPDNILIMGKFDRGGGGGTVAVCNCIKLKGTDKLLELSYSGRKILYFIEFSFPRFLNIKPFERLKTIVHELFHISSKFDGSLREHRHGKAYDDKIDNLALKYFHKTGMPKLLTAEFSKIKFLKWKTKPRYSSKKKSYDETDTRISTCNLNVYKKRLNHVYSCPLCKREFFLGKKIRGFKYYFCKSCIKKGEETTPSKALIYVGTRDL